MTPLPRPPCSISPSRPSPIPTRTSSSATRGAAPGSFVAVTISPTTLDGARTRRTAAQMLWPLTIFLIVHRAWVLPHQSGETDDFTTVWRALVRFGDGIPVYTANYNHV